MWQKEIMGLLVISTLSIAMTTVIACVHSGYITVTMTATATAIVERHRFCFAFAVGSRDGSCNPQMSAMCALGFTEKIAIHAFGGTISKPRME